MSTGMRARMAMMQMRRTEGIVLESVKIGQYISDM
jgi:hypothetical protein